MIALYLDTKRSVKTLHILFFICSCNKSRLNPLYFLNTGVHVQRKEKKNGTFKNVLHNEI